MLKKKVNAAFLDRDGVINKDIGYINSFNKMKMRNGIIKGLKHLMSKNYLLFIVTNQAGVAKGVITLEELKEINKKLILFFKKKRIVISKIEYCPHHKDGKIKIYKKNCKCRKPGNLMIKRIYKKWKINKKKSFMIGDRISDKKCALKSNLYFEYAKPNFFKQVENILNKI